MFYLLMRGQHHPDVNMLIVHSYVKLPEGKQQKLHIEPEVAGKSNR
jgi:hypothetical protein